MFRVIVRATRILIENGPAFEGVCERIKGCPRSNCSWHERVIYAGTRGSGIGWYRDGKPTGAGWGPEGGGARGSCQIRHTMQAQRRRDLSKEDRPQTVFGAMLSDTDARLFYPMT